MLILLDIHQSFFFLNYMNFPGDLVTCVVPMFPISVIAIPPFPHYPMTISQARHLGATFDSSVTCQEQ